MRRSLNHECDKSSYSWKRLYSHQNQIQYCSITAIDTDIEAKNHRPGSFSSETGYHRPEPVFKKKGFVIRIGPDQSLSPSGDFYINRICKKFRARLVFMRPASARENALQGIWMRACWAWLATKKPSSPNRPHWLSSE